MTRVSIYDPLKYSSSFTAPMVVFVGALLTSAFAPLTQSKPLYVHYFLTEKGAGNLNLRAAS